MRRLATFILPLLILGCATFLSAPERDLLGRWEGSNADGESTAMIFTASHRVQVLRETDTGQWQEKGKGRWSMKNGQLTINVRGEVAQGQPGAAGYLHLTQQSNNRSVILKKED